MYVLYIENASGDGGYYCSDNRQKNDLIVAEDMKAQNIKKFSSKFEGLMKGAYIVRNYPMIKKYELKEI